MVTAGPGRVQSASTRLDRRLASQSADEKTSAIDEQTPTRRAIETADDERRRIERALHDGVQQDLVAIAMRLQLARGLVESDAPAALRMLDEIRLEVHEALDGVRQLADGIYPAILDARGLGEALRAFAARHPGAAIDADGLGRYSTPVETAVYFWCRSLIEGGESTRIRIREAGGALHLTVERDAVDEPAGRDRIEALGGRIAASGAALEVSIPLA